MDENFVYDMILGSLLGDAHIERSFTKNHKNPSNSIIFTQSCIKEQNYLKLKYNLCKNYLKVNDIRNGHNHTNRFSISATEKELIKEMINLTRYEDGKRKIPNIDYISPIVLLFWYLDDGSLTIGIQKRKSKKSSLYRKLRIALQSFNDNDIIELANALNYKYNLKLSCNYEKGKIVSIGISNNINEICKFLDIIYPYKNIIPVEMHYKFCLCYHETMKLHNDELIKYNCCNFYNTGICNCRNKDLSIIYQ